MNPIIFEDLYVYFICTFLLPVFSIGKQMALNISKNLEQTNLGQLILGKKTTISHLNDREFLLNYWVNGQEYKLIITPERGPMPYSHIISISDKTNVTQTVFSFIGPHRDFHGRADHLTPVSMGFIDGLEFYSPFSEEPIAQLGPNDLMSALFPFDKKND